MKLPATRTMKLGLLMTLALLALVVPLAFWVTSPSTRAQDTQPAPEQTEPAPIQAKPAQPTNASSEATPAAEPSQPAPVPAAQVESNAPPSPGQPPAAPAQEAPAAAEPEPASEPQEIQLSFQGANVDLVVQWLAKTTGKSVVKHPRVQCQLTIVSSKKLPMREAITLVYRALALEGFAAVETAQSILLVPEGQEPKLRPELIGDSHPDLPEGRQLLLRIFTLTHIPAGELKEKIRSALSDKGTIEISDRANQLIVTDYTDNVRLLGELVRELDVPASGDTVIEFYSLKHSEAEELGNLLTLVLNSQAAPPSSPGRPSSSPSRSSPSSSGSGPHPPGSSPEPSGGGSSGASGATPGGVQAVRFWPDRTANRLIVAAPKSKLPEIEKLITLLDSEKPEDVSVRVLPLKIVSAEDLVKDIGPLFQKMSGQSLKEKIEVTASTRANALVVLSSQANFKTIERLVAALDTEEAQEKAMRAFPLRNADAEDVAKQLQELNSEPESTRRYPFYIFSSSFSGRPSQKATFVADRRRNTVIVQAAPVEMENIARLIAELDEPVTDDSLAPKIFRLKYVSAIDIEDVLNELFLKRNQSRSYWDYYYDYEYGDNSDQQGGRLYGKIRVTSEPYANAIIVTANSLEHLAAVEEVITQLDVPSQAAETTVRVELKFAKAATVANSVNILFAKGGSPPLRQVAQPGQPTPANPQDQTSTSSRSSFELGQEAKEEGYYPWLGGQPDTYRTTDGRTAVQQVSDLVGRVRVVPDQRSNSLLVSANVHLLSQVMKIVEDLDVPTAQVLIEAKIVEVSTDALDKLGVRWSPDGTQVFTADDFDNSILANARGAYLNQFGPALANGLSSGVLETTFNLDLLIQFMRKTTDARVLAEPQINIADNEVGKLFVGAQVPFIERSQSTDVGSLNQSFSYKDVGIILEVTPHINTSGDVALRIRAESSAIVPGQTLFGGVIIDTRNFRTDLTAKSGQTLVLGGIIQKQISDTVRKVPVLGSIPGLGWAFKKKDKTTRDVELMVFLRPKVVRTPEEAQQLMEEIERKAPLIRGWRDEALPAQPEEKAGDATK